MSKALTNLHHATLLVGDREEASAYFKEILNEIGFKLANNPDLFSFNVETFGIDEARQLKVLSARRAIGDKKIFLISPLGITVEAQNALLKTFEEPLSDTHFFLAIREESLIVKTLLSRMTVHRVGRALVSNNDQVKKFLSMSLKDRLLFTKKFVDDESNLADFLDSLLLILKINGSKDLLQSVFNIRRLITETALLPRLALEHLALILPRVGGGVL